MPLSSFLTSRSSATATYKLCGNTLWTPRCAHIYSEKRQHHQNGSFHATLFLIPSQLDIHSLLRYLRQHSSIQPPRIILPTIEETILTPTWRTPPGRQPKRRSLQPSSSQDDQSRSGRCTLEIVSDAACIRFPRKEAQARGLARSSRYPPKFSILL